MSSVQFERVDILQYVKYVDNILLLDTDIRLLVLEHCEMLPLKFSISRDDLNSFRELLGGSHYNVSHIIYQTSYCLL